ncbi:M12 family metallo-peptidase [Soonwooa sp.]|uniref:M12 family metallo-peptidase n=1 Tax=Soonwooa sp. TaxID=1938592 RepID=UPI00260B874A|nr:M12 family metallo-peptidase [Soonwooa sp.]
MKRFLQVVFLFSVISLSFGQSRQMVAKKIEDYKASRQAFASYNLFQKNDVANRNDAYKKAATDAIALNLDKKQLQDLVAKRPTAIEMTFPYRESSITVELVQNDIFGGQNNLIVQTDKGEFKNYKPGVYYQGIVKGDPSSIVAFSFFDNDVVGIASDLKKGNVVLGKALTSEDFVVYSDATLTGESKFVCKTDEMMENQKQKVSFDPTTISKTAATTENCVRVYYEICNKPYVQNGRDITKTTNWITAIHNNIGTLYNNDGVKMSLHEIYIWTDADPYTGGYSENLALFRTNRPTFNGDLAHLVNYPTTTSVAYLNSLCTTNKHAYSGIAMTYGNVPTYSWTIMAMTHEMGHSLGSPHTHACVWNGDNTPIDGCGPSAGYSEGCDGPIPTQGTIMSYCHLVGGVGVNLALGFGPQPGALIRQTVDSKSCLNTDCITGCNPTMSNLQISDLTSNSAVATIVDTKGGTEWKYRVAKANGTVVKEGVVTNKVINITNLEPNTYYYVSAGANCGGENAFAYKQLIMTDAQWCGTNLNFTDTGGENDNYGNNELIIKTFTPANPDDKIKLTFTEFATEQGRDFMRIYNGPNIASGSFLYNGGVNISGTQDLGSFESTHATGAITIRFSSNESLVDKGWIAKVECKTLSTIDVKTIRFAAVVNSSKTVLNIKSNKSVAKLEIFDMTGKIVKTDLALDRDYDVNISQLAAGVYIAYATIDGQVVSKKFVK